MVVEKSRLRRCFPFKVVVLALLLSLLITDAVYAVLENHKLSGGNISGGDVDGVKISPDGRFTVFRGDVRVNDRRELFSVPTLGGERVLLSSNLRQECIVEWFKISADSHTVVYSSVAGILGDEYCGLYAVPIEGGTPITLDSPDLSRELNTFDITGDSEYVLFDFLYRSSLYLVPLEGGARLPITEEIRGDIGFQITPDNQAIVVGLYSHVGDPHKIVHYDVEEEELTTLVEFEPEDYLGLVRLTPDGAYVIYDLEKGIQKELFSISIHERDLYKLNGSLVTGGNVIDFQIASNSAYVVYLADEIVDDEQQLFRVTVDGSDHERLTPWPLGTQITYKISPDSQWVVYRSDQDIPDKLDLFSILLAGGPCHKLTTGMSDFGDISHYEITNNSWGVVFTADWMTDGMVELFAIYINGAGIRRLNPNLAVDGDVELFKLLNNSQGVVYLADQTVTDVFNLYFVPILGGEIFKLNSALVAGGDVHRSFFITPDDKGVVYIADQDLDEVDELFITYDYQILYLPMITR